MGNGRKIKQLILGDGTVILNYPGMEINPYEENGQMAHVIWYAVFKDGKVTQRVNGAYVQQIIY